MFFRRFFCRLFVSHAAHASSRLYFTTHTQRRCAPADRVRARFRQLLYAPAAIGQPEAPAAIGLFSMYFVEAPPPKAAMPQAIR